MNEIKRQLDLKMGDTSAHCNDVMSFIELNKKKRPIKKKNSFVPVISAIVTSIAIIVIFILIGPFQDNQSTNDPTTLPLINEEVLGPDIEEIIDFSNELKKYFKPDGSIAYFEGEGNEYASYRETTTWISDNHVELLLDNGEGITQQIYRITNDSIVLLSAQKIDMNHIKPTLDEVEKLTPIQTILKAPFKDNNQIEGRTITTDVFFETPYGKFNTILVEYEDENTIERTYFAENNGIVAKTYTFADGYEITQYLQSVISPPIDMDSRNFNVYFTNSGESKIFSAAQLPFLKDIINSIEDDEAFSIEYTPLTLNNNLEFGVFSYNCYKENCSLAFVHHQNELFSTQLVTWGTYDHIVFSPDYKHFIIKVNAIEMDGEKMIERNRLVLVDALNYEINVPIESSSYFSSFLYPIVEWYWIDSNSVQLTVADINRNSFDAIYSWQNTSQKTKELVIQIP